jgi:hypothetical protein
MAVPGRLGELVTGKSSPNFGPALPIAGLVALASQ